MNYHTQPNVDTAPIRPGGDASVSHFSHATHTVYPLSCTRLFARIRGRLIITLIAIATLPNATVWSGR